MALRSKEAGVSPQEAGIYQASETGSTISPTTEQYSLLSQTPDPWTGKYTPTAQALGEQTSRLMPSAERQLVPGDEGYHDRLNKIIHQQNIEANPRPLTLKDIAHNLQIIRSGRIPTSETPDTRQLSLPGLNGGSSAPLNAAEGEYSWNDPSRDLQPTAWSQSKEHQLELLNPSRNIGYGKTNVLSPMRHAEVKRQPLGGRSLVRTGGGAQSPTASVEYPYTYVPSEQKDISEFATSGARDVTGAFLKGKIQQLPGPRDIEANIATQEAQGVSPLGRFSSLTSGEEYAPALGDRPYSMIDPRIVTAGEQNVRSKVEGYLGGKSYWMQKNAEQAKIKKNQQLSNGLSGMAALKEMAEQHPDEGIRNKALTLSTQINALYDITQDPNLIESVDHADLSPETVLATRTSDFVQRLTPNVTLPGGETVPISSFYSPHRAVGAGKSSNLTQVQALEGNLIGKQTTLSNVKAGILNQFGLGPTEKITNRMFNALPQSQRKTLVNAHTALTDAQTRLDAAKGNQILYSIPENVLEGTKSAPIISQATGNVVGMTAVPEEKALDLLNFYKMRANSGVGRAQVGGVGRRREELAAQGYTGGGDADYVEPVVFKDLNTGEYLDASDVSLADIAHGNVRESLGGTVSPQRLMGSSDRPYKGVSADVISPVSFDPSRQAELATAYPERVSPEGLIYSKAAMASPGGKSRPSLGTRFDVVPKTRTAAAKGSPRDIALRSIQAAEAARGSSLAFERASRTTLDDLVKRTASAPEQAFERASMHAAVWGEGLAPSQTIPLESPGTSGPVRTTREFQPQQLSIPGAGLTPQINTTPALEEAVATERYMGTRPGQNLRSAMQKALSKASARQTSLF